MHSIGLLLFRLRQWQAFALFIEDVIAGGAASVVSLGPSDMTAVSAAARQFGFDFDDAYQYAASQNLGLRLVSCDSDFNRTPEGRILPADALRM